MLGGRAIRILAIACGQDEYEVSPEASTLDRSMVVKLFFSSIDSFFELLACAEPDRLGSGYPDSFCGVRVMTAPRFAV
jgi:hypothetical protein